MVIRFSIPNGRMEINLETFFQEARRPQICKMLKWVRASWPNEENAREIREWLTDRRQDETDRAKAFAKKYVDCRTEHGGKIFVDRLLAIMTGLLEYCWTVGNTWMCRRTG